MIPAKAPRLLDQRRGSVDAWQARSRWQLIAAIAMPTVALLHIFDESAFYYFLKREFREFGFFLPDWYQVLRQVGNMMTWAIIALLVWSVDAARIGRVFGWASMRRAWMIVAGVGGAGILAEIGKLIAARERPISGGIPDYQGWQHHIPIIDPLLGQGNLGFPSSHTAVAFASAFVIGRLLPGSFPVMIFLALGCAWTRLIMGAHFLTDVAGGIAIAWIWITWLRPETRCFTVEQRLLGANRGRGA